MKSIILPCLIWSIGICGLLFWQQTSLEKAEADIARLETELAAARRSAEHWKLTADQARVVQDAQTRQAQACLEREAAATIELEHWQDVMARMQSRDMGKEEKTGVPDDATRRALLADLDRPW